MNEILNKIAEAVNSCLGPLADMKITGADVRDLLIQFCATIILFIVVKIFFWKPITDILEKRREVIDSSLEQAKKSEENSKLLEEEKQQELMLAKQEIKALLDKAEKDANIKREQIILEANKIANQRLANLEFELEQEKNSMEKQIRKEIIDIAFAAAEKIAAKEIDQGKYSDVIDEILKGASE